MCNLNLTYLQDLNYLYDTNNETAGAFVPAQILYDAFHGRYHNSAGAIVLLFIIWGSFFFGGLSITTSAARVVSKYVPTLFKFVWELVEENDSKKILILCRIVFIKLFLAQITYVSDVKFF